MHTVLFICPDNAARSLIAAAWFNRLADTTKARALSAGVTPASAVAPEVIPRMHEVGMNFDGVTPRAVDPRELREATWIICLGGARVRTENPTGQRQEWDADDLAGASLDRARAIRDDLRTQVQTLVDSAGWMAPKKPRVDDVQLLAIANDGSIPFELAIPEVVRELCELTARGYAANGWQPPWGGYIGRVGNDLVGGCAYKTPPRGGRMEIAYYVFPTEEGRGIATAMANTLVMTALALSPETILTAQTLACESASTSILRKLGFAQTGEIQDPEDGALWTWELPK